MASWILPAGFSLESIGTNSLPKNRPDMASTLGWAKVNKLITCIRKDDDGDRERLGGGADVGGLLEEPLPPFGEADVLPLLCLWDLLNVDLVPARDR